MSTVKETSSAVEKIDVALADSKRMQEDIIESMSTILNQSSEEQYRPIMDSYVTNLKSHRALASISQREPDNMRRLDFKDPEMACSALQEGLQIHWEGKKMESSGQSDVPQNPVQLVQVD